MTGVVNEKNGNIFKPSGKITQNYTRLFQHSCHRIVNIQEHRKNVETYLKTLPLKCKMIDAGAHQLWQSLSTACRWKNLYHYCCTVDESSCSGLIRSVSRAKKGLFPTEWLEFLQENKKLPQKCICIMNSSNPQRPS